MKNKKQLLFLILLIANNANIMAQCAMCRTSIESDLNSGGSIANGLNSGILYLMGIPYLLLMTGGYFFFKESVDAKLKSWKNKHFPTK